MGITFPAAEDLYLTKPELHVPANNSGINWLEAYDTYPATVWDDLLTVNLKNVFRLNQAVTPLLEAAASTSDPARVINIGSIDAIRVGQLETFAYVASKAGLHQLSRMLARHLGKRNVATNTIACGDFQTGMLKETFDQFKDHIGAGVPLGRIGGPEDIAGTCIWLSSRAGAWVNGATITLDGGSVVA